MRNSCGIARGSIGLVLSLAFTSGQCQHANGAPVDWPEVPTVQDWLAQELRETRRVARGSGDRTEGSAQDRSSVRKPVSVELLAIYGMSGNWAAHVRIGGHTHVLLPSGPDRADDGQGRESIVADRLEGVCLRLRYRATSRRLCLSDSTSLASAS